MEHLFFDDYSEGVHPALLEAMSRANDQQNAPYGNDSACELAVARISAFFDADLDIHFVGGGTQANVVGLASMLRNYEGVIAPESAHINVHETGGLEATGHKILSVASRNGKLTAAMIDEAVLRHEDEHTVLPRVVCLTQSTEVGTVYSRDELQEVVRHAKSFGLFVFLDGARLAMGLAESDMSPNDLVSSGVDMFYIGGTKVGAAFGEAIAIANPQLRKNFRYEMKMRGALMAKGVFLGLQFARFFDEDNLWLSLGEQSNAKARRLADGIGNYVEFPNSLEGNQLFVVLPTETVKELSIKFGFYEWSTPEPGKTMIRLVTSWATPDDKIDALIAEVRRLANPISKDVWGITPIR